MDVAHTPPSAKVIQQMDDISDAVRLTRFLGGSEACLRGGVLEPGRVQGWEAKNGAGIVHGV